MVSLQTNYHAGKRFEFAGRGPCEFSLFAGWLAGSYPANAVVCDVNITIPFDMPAPVSVMYVVHLPAAC